MNKFCFNILTIFPEFFESYLKVSLVQKGLREGRIGITLHNIRDFTQDKHHSVDDIPYGGGAGMVFKPEPVVQAVESVPRQVKSLRILLTPRGRLFRQGMARELAACDQLILICGRYEGMDERVRELVVDEEISVGDYVLNGGESAALVLIDTIVRLLPGFVGNEASLSEESFEEGLLEYPQYTRPPEFRGLKVPEVLLSGNHEAIREWREEQGRAFTRSRRPDILSKSHGKRKTVAKGKEKS